jgi:hypothetical protein
MQTKTTNALNFFYTCIIPIIDTDLIVSKAMDIVGTILQCYISNEMIILAHLC